MMIIFVLRILQVRSQNSTNLIGLFNQPEKVYLDIATWKTLPAIANENCKVKYEVVMKDERESGLREVLNLGHTVGRAIETVSDYQLLHGEALSIGIVAEVKLAYKLGYMTEMQRDAVIELLAKANLPIAIPDYIDREVLVKKLYTDNKE